MCFNKIDLNHHHRLQYKTKTFDDNIILLLLLTENILIVFLRRILIKVNKADMSTSQVFNFDADIAIVKSTIMENEVRSFNNINSIKNHRSILIILTLKNKNIEIYKLNEFNCELIKFCVIDGILWQNMDFKLKIVIDKSYLIDNNNLNNDDEFF